MTLADQLCFIDDDQIIKIAAADGNAFFFAGRAAVFKRNLMIYNLAARADAETAARNARRIYEARRAAPPLRQYYDSDEDHKRAIKAWRTEMKKRESYMTRKDKYLAEYQPLREREVLDVFTADSLVEPDATTVIYIDGEEIGRYWMVSEAEQRGEPFGFRRYSEIDTDGDDDAEAMLRANIDTSPNFVDMTGQRYGTLTVVGRKTSSRTRRGQVRWVCRCDCGACLVVNGSTLRRGSVRSCGSKECKTIARKLRKAEITAEEKN